MSPNQDKRTHYSLKKFLLVIAEPRLAGSVAMVGSVTYVVIFVMLGLVQPGYDTTRDTVSMLVLGEWGWVQSLNFLQMAVTVWIFGLGLGWSLHRRLLNPVSVVFSIMAVGLVIGTIFPTTPATPTNLSELSALSAAEKIHELMAFSMVVLAPLLLYPIFVSLKKSPRWRSFLPYTLVVFVTNCLVGLLWIYLLGYDWFWEWKGLLQKLMMLNVVVWLVVMGRELRLRSSN